MVGDSLRHVDRRIFFCRNAFQRGLNSLHLVNGERYMLADVGTKNLPSSIANPKLDVITGTKAMEPIADTDPSTDAATGSIEEE